MVDTKKVILLIEDNPLLTGMYSAAFKKKGIEVLVAHNGVDGLRIIEEHKPHLVLLDLFMPGMNGFDILEKIKSNPETKDIKVVMLTVSPKKEDETKARALGAIDYLLKQELHLNEIVDRALSHFENNGA